MSVEEKAFWIPFGFSINVFGSKIKVLPDDMQVVKLEDTKNVDDLIQKLYEFVCQGTTESSYEIAKAAFATMKYRMEILFPWLVK